MKLSLHSLACVVLAASGAQADKFLQSCDADSIVVKDNVIRGRCWNTRGSMQCSVLDLTNCVRNDYGTLREDPNGVGPHYPSSCTDCSNAKQTTGFFINGPSILHCNCRIGNGATTQAIIDLDTLVGNSDGFLTCARASGVPC